MSVTIRLARTGRKNLPSYRLVVTNTRDKRNGRFIDVIGHYNPSSNPVSFDYDKKLFEDWKKKGALVSSAIQRLIDGKYEYKVYSPSKDKKAAEKAAAAAKEEKKEVVENA
jgi:small subunit ribosomal protein S16